MDVPNATIMAFVFFVTLHGQEEGVRAIKHLVRSHVKQATLLSNVGAEVSFQLPHDASPSFQEMLTDIDSKRAELGVNRQVRDHTT